MNNEIFDTLVYTAEAAGERLDSFVASKTQLTRSRAQKLIEDGDVMVNGKAGAKNLKLKAGDVVEVSIPENEEYDAMPENIPLDVRYEDEHIIIVNKPVGMVVHPAPGHSSGTLVNALMYHCGDSLSGIGGVNRPGIVHRIDRDTSGLEGFKSVDTPQQCRFAGAALADNAIDLSVFDRNGDPLEDFQIAEVLDEVLGADDHISH